MIDNVKTRELEPFHVYVTGASEIGARMEGWRSTYLYFGRSKATKKFVWLFIGSLQETKRAQDIYDLGDLYASLKAFDAFEVTKSNKKVYKMVTFAKYNDFCLDITNYMVKPKTRMLIAQYLEV